jgi:phytol kinase
LASARGLGPRGRRFESSIPDQKIQLFPVIFPFFLYELQFIIMLAVILSLLGVLAVLLVDEFLWRRKLVHGELKRKFVHILVTAFVAFWPWIMSWKAIQLIGIAMALVLLLNRQLKILHYLGNIRQKTYGEVFLALAITATALITNNKVFFAIAMLHVALADGLAAIIGTKFGSNWQYKVLNHTKTVIGSMTFWVVSIFVLGGGLLAANDLIPISHYAVLLIVLPPVLTLVENVALLGTDNLAIPIVVVIALQLAQVQP